MSATKDIFCRRCRRIHGRTNSHRRATGIDDLTTVVTRRSISDNVVLIHEMIHNVCEPLNECIRSTGFGDCAPAYRLLSEEFSDLARRVRSLLPSEVPGCRSETYVDYLFSAIEMLPHVASLAMWRADFIAWNELDWFPRWIWQRRGIAGGPDSELGRTLSAAEDVVHRYIESRPTVRYTVPALERRIAQRQRTEEQRERE